jgi:hypothetical protein
MQYQLDVNPPGLSYNEFRLFADEKIKEEVRSIYVGIVKAFPAAKFNGRIYCVIKNDVFPNTQEWVRPERECL